MAKYNLQIREEELKNKVAADFFGQFDTTQIVGNIDFSVALPTGCAAHSPAEALCLDLFDADFFLWGEAKKGDRQDIDDSLVQLLITIIKAKTFNSYLPPLYLAAFDAEKIAFLPYDTDLQKQILFDEHLENTVDWKSVTPSDHHSAAFLKVKDQAAPLLERKILFDYEKDGKDLQRFIRDNFKAQKQGTNKINITLNRMTAVFNRWLETVKPTIRIDWANLAKENIVPADFFLADALSKNNWSLGESLKVLLRTDFYMMNLKVRVGDAMMDTFTNVQFTDRQKAHQAFWNRYNRPPSKRERERMQVRRDLLIEPDRRERKGAFFTPHQWVALSQEYLTQTLGENWQEEYYVWDCCAGTGNLLYGLTEKERIFASTLDDADVRFMQQQDFLLPKHVFQFDFLNDDLQDADKVPQDLRRILADPDLRRKLVIYINPPYAEATTATTVSGTGHNKAKVATENATYLKYKSVIGKASNELFAQFFIRIYDEIPGTTLAEFSTLKILQASNFADFRSVFRAKLLKAFAVPAKTFDNVKGSFPIGFFIWNTNPDYRDSIGIAKGYNTDTGRAIARYGSTNDRNPLRMRYGCATDSEENTYPSIDIYDAKGVFLGQKSVFPVSAQEMLNRWVDTFKIDNPKDFIGYLSNYPSDFQNQNHVAILSQPQARICWKITKNEVTQYAIYFAVRHCIESTWLNDRDQFLYPNDGWKTDYEFQADCLVYTLFHGQNRISIVANGKPDSYPSPSSADNNVKHGSASLLPNHWIPFTEKEVGAQSLFTSHFMSDYLAGKIVANDSYRSQSELFEQDFTDTSRAIARYGSTSGRPICFTPEARAVMDAGRELWRYYHKQPDANADASYYDIRRYFQGTDDKGRMNPDSEDAEYMRLWDNLKTALRQLAAHIEPKVYQYGFLLGSNLKTDTAQLSLYMSE